MQEVKKMEKARIIRKVIHPEWVANPVVVPKHTGEQLLCVDYTNLNKACPKDHFPLPRIDHIVGLHRRLRTFIFCGCLFRISPDQGG